MASGAQYKDELSEIKDELRRLEISNHDITLASHHRGQNEGRGYNEATINNMLLGRTTLRLDLLQLMADLIENKVVELRHLSDNNPAPIFQRINELRAQRVEMEGELLGDKSVAA